MNQQSLAQHDLTVILHCSMHVPMLIFLPKKHNDLKPCGANISCARLEASAQKKVSIMAGPQFGEVEGHQLLIHEALHGHWTLGQRWHNGLSKCVRMERFTPCHAHLDIWMQPKGNDHKHVAVHVHESST